MNTEGKISERLNREADGIPGPRFTLDQVVRRGRRRRTMQWAARGLGGFATVVLIVGLAAWLVAPGSGGIFGIQSPAQQVVNGEVAPEPLFDPDVLGAEVRLIAGGQPTDAELAVIAAGVGLSSEPIISVGRLEGTPWRIYRAYGHIAPGENTAGDSYQTTGTFWCDWAFNDDGTNRGPACPEAARGTNGGTVISMVVDGLTVLTGIPETVAVVTFESQAGSWWQRPIAGAVAFASETAESRPLFLDSFGVSIGSDSGPPDTWRDPMPSDATAVGPETLTTPDLLAIADVQPEDLLYQLQLSDGAVLVRIRFAEPPLLFGTSCDLAQSMPLPTRWQGACLEQTIDGTRVTGPWFYGTNLIGGGWTDDGWSGPPRVITPNTSLPKGVTTTQGPTD